MEALKAVAVDVSKLSSGKQQALFLSGVGSLIFAIHKVTASMIRSRNRKLKEADAAVAAEGNTPRLDPLTGEIVQHLTKLPESQKKRVAIDGKFFGQFQYLLKIVLPGVQSKEFLILLLHTGFLTARTFISIFIAKLDGRLVKTLVDRDGKKFLYFLMVWLGVAVPATYINSMIKFLESKLAIAFRSRLVEHSYQMYMKNETYYRVGNLDSRITNADQCLTEDVSKFCNFLAHLYSQISKPILDILLIGRQFYQVAKSGSNSSSAGILPFAISTLVVYSTARALQVIQPPFGRLAAEQQKFEGDLRYVHSRVITHAEEIAFYNGEKIEQHGLYSRYLQLVKHMNVIFRTRIIYNAVEGFFMKYVWSACGLLMIALPAFFFDSKKTSVSTRTRDYVTSRQLLVSGAEAIERIMLAYKEVNELAGYTDNVHDMMTVFDDVQRGKFVKSGVKSNTGENGGVDIRTQRGVVQESDFVRFENVPIVSPNGDILVKALSFEMRPGMHLLITGPNGCGKSSLFRILGGLWPVYGGKVTKPPHGRMFYIPQRPYLTIGTLRDQVIYPDTAADMKRKGISDADLHALLEWVNLNHVVVREGGWDSRNDWQDVLSGGEKQRVGMVRLFYHKPSYAILDECTSAVSMDVEGKMYQHAIDIGITLITVTHRPSLWKFHSHLLQFDGQGNVNFSELNATARLTFKEEKSKLEQNLAELPKMTERLKELCELLGEDSVLINNQEGDKQVEEEESLP
jgi:ABC-type uncharacterized transport system fused permease/ATPase subunit